MLIRIAPRFCSPSWQDEPTEHAPQPLHREDRFQLAPTCRICSKQIPVWVAKSARNEFTTTAPHFAEVATSFTSSGSVHLPQLVGAIPRLIAAFMNLNTGCRGPAVVGAVQVLHRLFSLTLLLLRLFSNIHLHRHMPLLQRPACERQARAKSSELRARTIAGVVCAIFDNRNRWTSSFWLRTPGCPGCMLCSVLADTCCNLMHLSLQVRTDHTTPQRKASMTIKLDHD